MIAVVIPTIRKDNYRMFVDRWTLLFSKHNIKIFTVWDGDNPRVDVDGGSNSYGLSDLEEVRELIYNYNDGVRNLGFAAIAKYHHDIDIIITLDDDCFPIEGTDPIQEHISALSQNVPVSWMNTIIGDEYMRGFPYGVRQEAEVVLSHGVWDGIQDWDASTQLVRKSNPVEFYRGPIPKGTLFPVCIMNVAFKKKILPYYYQAPMGVGVGSIRGVDRFADIWSGINVKRKIDELGWAAVSGFSKIYHSRASNVFTNLIKEARGVGLNEKYWMGDDNDPYFNLYHHKFSKWEKIISTWLNQ